ncbi:YycH family regulatory protein [Salipaludibacillus agaradhaerens]|uniref:YycH family regulatory protein n=1 Tax=Salipaludibacillus agaradhaerens TaxID=76935 RepID=UPI0009989D13|nr:two-component system activity regulator YycH [Salipaludibacillus agaradhaerens]
MIMIESIKTTVLWILILSSITLTWLLWTYQPEYDALEESNETYVEIEDLGDTRTLSEVVQPRQIIIHREDEQSMILPLNDVYKDILQELEEVEIDYVYPQWESQAPSIEREFTGMELIFDDPLESEWIEAFFTMDEEHLAIEQVDRITFLLNPEDEENTDLLVQFVDMAGEAVYESDISLTMSDLEEMYEGTADKQVSVEKYLFRGESETFQPVSYVTTESVSLEKYTYETTDLSAKAFTQILFNDPSVIENYPQAGQGETYTDGNRIMSLNESNSILHFVRPDIRGGSPADVPSVIEDSLDFINNHSGWTNDYLADNWTETDLDDHASFRLHVQGLPVLASNQGQDHYFMIDVTRAANSITEYTRPMYQLANEPLEKSGNVTLPSFEEVQEHIREYEAFGNRAVEDITIGHYMVRQRSYATFEPGWYVKIDGRWTMLDFRSNADLEVSVYGLE